MEAIWFVMGGVMLFMAVDVTQRIGWSESWYYFLLSVAAFTFYYFRRRARITRR